MKVVHTYKAYTATGQLTMCTWASAAATQATERAAYQERLNHGEIGWVDITSSDPHEKFERLYPQSRVSR